MRVQEGARGISDVLDGGQPRIPSLLISAVYRPAVSHNARNPGAQASSESTTARNY
jgi:hypothetical protein